MTATNFVADGKGRWIPAYSCGNDGVGWAWSRIWDAQQFLITFAVLLSRGRFWVAPVEGEGRKRDFCEGMVKREIIREFFIQMPNP